MPRVVKRYANRKLYDTQSSRYVTLEEVGEMVRVGEDVQIIDNNSKEDLTSVTLAQIILGQEKRKGVLQLEAMRGLIQTGGESLQQLAGQLRDAKEKVGERVGRVFRRGEREAEESDDKAESQSIRDLIESSQKALDEWQRRIDERVRSAMDSLSPLSGLHKEVEVLAKRVADLESKVAKRNSKRD